jgi:O-antigen/teichoic acid export membrane protein
VNMQWGGGYMGLILANLLGVALMAAMCWRYVGGLGVNVRDIAIDRWPPLLRASLPFGIIALALGLSYKFDAVLLSLFRNDAETGYYTAAYSLVFSAVTISNVLNTALYPSLTRQAISTPQILPVLYGHAIRYLLIISLPIAVGVSVLADRLVPFLLGEEYLPAVLVLRVVIWAVPLMYASEFLGYVVVIDGHERRVARSILVSTLCNVLLNLLVVPQLGSRGASMVTVLTEGILVAQYLWLLRGMLTRLHFQGKLLRTIVAVGLMGCLAAVLGTMPLPVVVGTAALTYGLLLIALGALGRDELTLLRKVRRNIAPQVSSG